MTEKSWEEMSWKERRDEAYRDLKKRETGWMKEEMEETRRRIRGGRDRENDLQDEREGVASGAADLAS